MAASLTYRQLRKAARVLARDIRRSANDHKANAHTQGREAKDTSQVADQIAGLGVDAATVAESREASRITLGLSTVALTYAASAEEAARAAAAAERQAVTDHGGIQEARDRQPVAMAKSRWYTQE